jgi:hypothetical protein
MSWLTAPSLESGRSLPARPGSGPLVTGLLVVTRDREVRLDAKTPCVPGVYAFAVDDVVV